MILEVMKLKETMVQNRLTLSCKILKDGKTYFKKTYGVILNTANFYKSVEPFFDIKHNRDVSISIKPKDTIYSRLIK